LAEHAFPAGEGLPVDFFGLVMSALNADRVCEPMAGGQGDRVLVADVAALLGD
jgi:hypothetical protein